jgi:hypothetical protein
LSQPSELGTLPLLITRARGGVIPATDSLRVAELRDRQADQLGGGGGFGGTSTEPIALAGSRTDDSWGDGGGADDRCVGVLSWLAEASGTVNTWLARLVGVAALVLVSASDAEGARSKRKKAE